MKYASGRITTQNLSQAGDATAGSAVSLPLLGDDGDVAIHVTDTYTGALTPQGTIDQHEWIDLAGVTDASTGVITATIPSGETGIYRANITGLAGFRLSANGAVTGAAMVSIKSVIGSSADAWLRALFAAGSAATLAALKATPVSVGRVNVLGRTATLDGYEGTFIWAAGNFTTLAAADPTEAIYVASNSVAISAGAWVRETGNGPHNLSWFGILPGSVAASVVQSAINVSAGREVLFDRPGDYTLTGVTTNTLSWMLSVTTDNTWLVGVPGARLVTAANAALVFFAGPARNGAGFTSWEANRFLPNLTVRSLTGTYAKGAPSVTLATPAEASNFPVGRLVWIRTGNYGAAPSTYQPDAEFNYVATSDSGTGVIGLRLPLSKPYQQQYYITGTNGPTSTTVTANPAPFGIVDADPYVLRNVGIRGLDLESGGNPVHIYQVWGGGITGEPGRKLKAKSPENFTNWYYRRDWNYKHLDVYCTNAAAAKWLVPLGATGDVDCVAEDINGVSAGLGFIHCHEGPANCWARRITIRSRGGLATQQTVSVRGQAYDCGLLDSYIAHSGTTQAAAYVAPEITDGFLFDGNTVFTNTTDAVVFSGPGARFGANNRILAGAVVFWNAATGKPITGGHQAVQLEVLETWVLDDVTTSTLGVLPAYTRIQSISIECIEAVNAGTTADVEVGTDADNDAYAVAVSVLTTGEKVWTPGVGNRYSSSARTIKVYLKQTGAAATTGKVQVTLTYARVGRVPL